jgi:hypothetical protein
MKTEWNLLHSFLIRDHLRSSATKSFFISASLIISVSRDDRANMLSIERSRQVTAFEPVDDLN